MDRGEPSGVQFPADERGRRSSLVFGRGVMAAAAAAASPELARSIAGEGDWRHAYPGHLRELVAAGLGSCEAAHGIARAGLNALHEGLEFVGRGGCRSLRAAMAAAGEDRPLATVRLRGSSREAPRLTVPYRGQSLSGDALRGQLDRWVRAQVAEPSFAEAVGEVIDHPEWLDLSDWRIALLGAGAEVGPLAVLAGWRAKLMLVDVPEPRRWARIVRLATAGNGEVQLPLAAERDGPDDDPVARAGADLTREAPRIAAWLAECDGPLVVGGYAYLDGEAHVRVAAAMDAIVERLMAGSAAVVPACLLTPTDVHAVPAAAVEAARRGWTAGGTRRLLRTALHLTSGGRFFARNYPDDAPRGKAGEGIADALVQQQGPNYALAKRLQQWRMTLTGAAGRRLSVHVAPAARTRSVMKNRALAAAYRGAHHFGVEIFEPDCANALMAALLVRDLRRPPPAASVHPGERVMEAALHCGLWRLPYAARSALPLAALLGLVGGGSGGPPLRRDDD